MFSSYTSNQKSAIATFLFAALWALISLEIAIRMGLQSPSALTAFAIMTIIAWILIPFYLKKIKLVFIIGIIVLVLGLIGLFASPGSPPWYSFSNPISVVKEGSFVLNGLACIYFSYKSYKELSRTDIP